MDFEIAHPEEISVTATIEWSKPYPLDAIFSGHADENEDAHFYAITGYTENNWWSFYIGMVYYQDILTRHGQLDHKQRLQTLKSKHKDIDFSLSLGVLNLEDNKQKTESVVNDIEGLLIYANWHEDLENEKKISHFSSKKSYLIKNEGFIEHLQAEDIVYGVMRRYQ